MGSLQEKRLLPTTKIHVTKGLAVRKSPSDHFIVITCIFFFKYFTRVLLFYAENRDRSRGHILESYTQIFGMEHGTGFHDKLSIPLSDITNGIYLTKLELRIWYVFYFNVLAISVRCVN